MDITFILSHITPFLWLGIATASLIRQRKRVYVCCAAWILIGFIPVGALTIAETLRGFLADFSLTSLLIAAYVIIQYTRYPQQRFIRHDTSFNVTLLVIAASSILLYGSDISAWSSFDLYAIGYHSYSAVLILIGIAFIASLLKNHLLAIVLLCLGYCHYFNGLHFDNLWNDSLDIWLGFGAIIYSFFWGARNWHIKKTLSYHQ